MRWWIKAWAAWAALSLSVGAAGESAEATFRKAASALASQDYKRAEQGFLAVLRDEPRNIGAMGNLGVIYSRTNRLTQAIDIYQRALRLAPGERFLSTNLGLAFIKQEQHAAALPIFDKLAAADPGNRQALEMGATCRLALGQTDAALEAIQRLLQADSANPGLLYLQGVALTRLNRTAEAHAAFARLMEAASPAQANFLMGKASYETGVLADAVDYYQKALTADPSLEGIHRELGKAYVSLRDDAKAEQQLRQAGPDDGEALYFLGALLSRIRPAEAIPLLDQARAMNPAFWGPLYYLGRIYAERGKLQLAIPLLERAAKLNPSEAAIQYQLGRALMRVGRDAEGRSALARVQELKRQAAPSITPLP
jgi:tetratricopeptide (TPR) repeat protein